MNNSLKIGGLLLALAATAAGAQGQPQAGAPAAAPAATAAAAQPAKGDPVAGREKAQACLGCHGIPEYKTAFPQVYRVPLLGGQNDKYIEAALGEYKSGARHHPSMDYIAASLSDQDIADLAAYFSSNK